MHISPTFQLLAAALLVEGSPVQDVERRQAVSSATEAIGSVLTSAISTAVTSITGSAASETSSAASQTSNAASVVSSVTDTTTAAPTSTAASNATSSSSSPTYSIVKPTQGSKGKLVKPDGGIGFNETPTYMAKSDYDYQSLNLGLHQELIELDLFHHGLAQFSDSEFEAAGLSAQDRFLIEYMADQEVGHAEVISNIIGRTWIYFHHP